MFEKPEEPSELFAEIAERGVGWRAEHLDLPVTLLFLSRIKRALAGLSKGERADTAWDRLKARGKSLARRRALFVAAEAVGRLRRGAQADERGTIRQALGVIVEEGTTLDKVRALRALSFIPSDECVPVLKRGMQDRSPWVQATALNILLNMNLRQSASRSVLIEFLFDRFERQTQREEVLNLRAVVRNFHVNKGLFVGLLKAPGGKRLALLSLRLWATALLLSFFIALAAGAGVALRALAVAAVAIFGFLVAAAEAIFVKLPRLLTSTPGVPRQALPREAASYDQPPRPMVSTPSLPREAALFVYRLFIWLPYKILSTPLWARDVEMSFGSLRERYVYLALLDYVFIFLLVIVLLPHGTLWLALALAVYWILLAASSEIETPRTAEWFRLCVRFAGATALAWYAYRAGQDERLVLALALLAAAQGVWLLPLMARGFVAFVAGVVYVLRAVGRYLAEGIKVEAQHAVAMLREKAPPRERLLSEAASLTGEWLRTFWLNLRPHLKPLALKGLVVAFLLAAGYYAMRRYNVSLSDASRLTGPELGPLLVSLKPHLYFAVGGAAVAILCALLLLVFHLLWDELWIVERVTFRTRSQNVKRFKSDSDFLAYVFQIVRDQTLSTGLRVRAASALAQVPKASQEYVDQLTDLAEEEELPISVSDAVSKVVEEAEKRLKRRAKRDEFKVDMALVNRQLGDIWKPGEVLRPWIRKGLAAVLLLPSLLAGAVWLYWGGGDRPADLASLVCLGAGCGLLIVYICVARWQGEFVKWSLLCGLILLVSVFMRPLQAPLFVAGWGDYFKNGAVGLVELSAFSALLVPVLVAGVVARAGHTLYLLGSDVAVNLELEGKPNLFERRLKRLRRQEVIIRRVLIVAVCATLAQSHPLQEYLERRGEKLPFFATNGEESEVELKDIPTDGRVVRVALVQAEDQFDWKALGDNRAPSPDQTRSAVIRSLKDGGLAPLKAKAVAGDVWLYSQDGELRGLLISPIKCLVPSAATEDTVTFNLHSLCSWDPKAKLVAVVYDKRRSDFIKGMRFRKAERADINAIYPSHSWLLLDTNSPFIKAVWSHVF